MPAKTTELVWAITQPQWPWRISEGNLIINEQSDSSTDAIVSEARPLARATIVLVDGRVPYEGRAVLSIMSARASGPSSRSGF